MINNTESVILELLVELGDMYGLQMVAASCGRLKRGSVYVALGLMEDRGLVERIMVNTPAGEQGPPRRKATATKQGRLAYKARVAHDRVMAATLKTRRTG